MMWQDGVVIPVVAPRQGRRLPPTRCTPVMSGWANDLDNLQDWYREADGIASKASGLPAWASIVLRRLLIAMPSLLGISVVLFTVLALAPGDPFAELATNPNVPPEVRAALRAKFGLDDPVSLRYLHWLSAMLHGDWGFSFVSRIERRHADPAARCRPRCA